MMMSPSEFWQAYLNTLAPEHPHRESAYHAWGFGNSPQMAQELGQLVYDGLKTATASLHWGYETGQFEEPMPQVGDLSIILDGQEQPRMVIQTEWVAIMPFDQVDERQAWEEGEGDRSLAFWRRVHWEFFSAECADLGLTPNETMPVVCERFRVLYRR
jgi:uncharacterized protein YhfF